MNLRELIIERIFFACTDWDLQNRFQLQEDDVKDLSDIDLFELYERVVYEVV